MSPAALPSDASSLLVPLNLDVWVVDSDTQEALALYYPDYSNLASFQSPLPQPFSLSDTGKVPGIHLHWALPDALTHARQTGSGSALDNFPLVPNRWLIARFNAVTGGWQSKLWVVQSDYGGGIGATAADLSGNRITSISLAAGASQAVGAGVALQIMSADNAATVTTSSAVAAGATQIPIQAADFASDLPAGSYISLAASSPFLDPVNPSYMQAAPDQSTEFGINSCSIGANYTIEEWEAAPDPGTGQLFLRAVGPANVSFAAYAPFVQDVFSFLDPVDGSTGPCQYTYLVTGWYSDPAADPLSGVVAYDADFWPSVQDWQNQTPAQRLQTILDALKWSIGADAPSAPPTTSLYHAAAVDVQWPSGTVGSTVDPNAVRVVVGNTSTDALAALIQFEALAQAKLSDPCPDDTNPWVVAGQTLAQLVQAAMYDLLDDFGKPGGSVLVNQQIEDAWFGSQDGGTVWEVVSAAPQQAGAQVQPPALSSDQQTALASSLASLNQAQARLDADTRQLQWLQANLYIMWWKIGVANSYGWNQGPPLDNWSDIQSFMQSDIYPDLLNSVWDQYCAVTQEQGKLPQISDNADPTAWADQNWSFPNGSGGGVTLSDLGLQLKANARPPFRQPSDPVVLIAGVERAQLHGEDGRNSADGTLACRLPGETITGLTITGQTAITLQGLTPAVDWNPCGSYTAIPSVPSLIGELFLADPQNAPAIAAATGIDAATIQAAIQGLLEGTATSASWAGTPPVSFAIEEWQQAWSPLFLEWEVNYYPTGSVTDGDCRFSLNDWKFDGAQFTWNGTGFNAQYSASYKGRTLLTPQAPLLFKDKIAAFLKGNSSIDSSQVEQLIETVSSWDILSQALSGFTDQLLTLDNQETFPPPAASANESVACPRPQGATPPPVGMLVGGQYHNIPVLEPSGSANNFYPIRGGFLQFSRLRVVDAFGQIYDIQFESGFEPILAQGLAPANPPQGAGGGMIMLPPRIVQCSRLDLQWLSNDGSGAAIDQSANGNPVCGWLVPNHLDGGITVYGSDGVALGELLPQAAPYNWRPSPGVPGSNPPPAAPANIANAALKQVVTSLAGQAPDIFNDFLETVDETLWMVDPLGGRKDQFFSVLIGRPLAVVQMQLSLSVSGSPWFNQMWQSMLTSQTPPQWLQDSGSLTTISAPVRLGSLDLRNDGLIGYFLTGGTGAYSTFYSVHLPDDLTSGDTYIQPILNADTSYAGAVSLTPQQPAVTLTLLLDPRGAVHAYTGLLPVTSASLPGDQIEAFMRNLKVTFQAGPIIADPGALRIPAPAEQRGVWNWIQFVSGAWEQDAIVDANDQARFPDGTLQLREGWLQLTAVPGGSPASD